MRTGIAARLRKARKAQFKNAVDAAESLGVPYQTYIAHENANRIFDVESALLYSRRFRVGLDWLIAGVGRGPGGTLEEPKIKGQEAILATLRRIDGLEEEDHNLILGIIKRALKANAAGREQTPSDVQSPSAKPRHESQPLR